MPLGTGCCCCTCRDLEPLIECGAITIPGYSPLLWVNLSAYNDGCCYRGFFVADECEPTVVCEECLPQCSPTSRRGVDKYIYLGCTMEVFVWRQIYRRPNVLELCEPVQYWCRYVILTRRVDYATTIDWFQSKIDDETFTGWLDTCPFDCPVDGQCTLTTGMNPRYKCNQCTCIRDWWRIRGFDALPTGTIDFTTDDAIACLPQLTPCVPDRIPGDPSGGKIAHAITSAQCCKDLSMFGARSCSCDPLFGGDDIIGVEVCPDCESEPGDICFLNPDTWSIEIGACP